MRLGSQKAFLVKGTKAENFIKENRFLKDIGTDTRLTHTTLKNLSQKDWLSLQDQIFMILLK